MTVARGGKALAVAVAVLAGAAVENATASRAGEPATGPAKVVDRVYPSEGDFRYQVSHYGLTLAYSPASRRLGGTARIQGVARRRLRAFGLDLRGLHVTSLTLDGAPVRHRRVGRKVRVRPHETIRAGSRFEVVVRYRGRPTSFHEKGAPIPQGWLRTDDGAFVVGEPVGAPAWFPCNDRPTDKASYRFRVTVPKGVKAVANGRLQSISHGRSRNTFVWRERQPMASYLATVNIGRGKIHHGHVAGVPYWSMVDPREAKTSAPVLAKLGDVIRFERRLFGPYPFDSAGALVDHDAGFIHAALETQTRPIYDGLGDVATLAHETAHQWFGDSVSVRTWPDIWLNEGLAEFATWYWDDRHDGASLKEQFDFWYAKPASDSRFWNPPPGRPRTIKGLFGDSVYLRGAMALVVLRRRVGDHTLVRILHRWTALHRFGNATVPEFTRLAERVSGQNLDDLFHAWLYAKGKPTVLG